MNEFNELIGFIAQACTSNEKYAFAYTKLRIYLRINFKENDRIGGSTELVDNNEIHFLANTTKIRHLFRYYGNNIYITPISITITADI